MSFENQIILTVIDKLIIGFIILLLALFINRSLEKFKISILRQSKIKDIKFEKLSLIIEAIWNCNSALNEMVANFAKKEARGGFEGLTDIMKEDIKYKNQLQQLYLDSASKYSESISLLQKKINSSYFWIGKDLSEKAKKIASINYNYVLAIVNKSIELIKDIETLIREFEDLAINYIEKK